MFTARSKPDMTATRREGMNQHESEGSSTATRRRVLRSIGGAIAVGVTGGVDGRPASPSTSADSSPLTHRKNKVNENTTKTMNNKLGFLALPGMSFTSLLVHLPSVFNVPDKRTPVIIIDNHDYERFRGRILQENTQKLRYMGMVFDDLRRRGALKFIDYANFYSVGKQQQILQENRGMLAATDDDVNRRAARRAAKGWIGYGRGAYQTSFREGLGENPDAFGESRHKVAQQRDRMDRGRGDPIGWNENVLNQYRAALEVRYQADRNLDIDIPYIIGQGESSLISTYDVNTDEDHPAASRFIEIDPDQTTQTREMLAEIADEGRKIAGVQHSDWFILGPRLALPQYDDIFDFNIDKISKQVRLELDERTLEAQAKEALAILNKRAERPMAQMEAEADYIAEKYESQQHSDQILKKLDEMVALSNYSRDFRDLNDEAGISQAALYLAASIKRDPVRRYNEDEVYRRGVDMINRFEMPMVTLAEIDDFRHRGTFRRQGNASDDPGNWYQSTERQRSLYSCLVDADIDSGLWRR
jgi:hypothetical protein